MTPAMTPGRGDEPAARPRPTGREPATSARALRRGRDAVQLGWTPETGGVVLGGLEPVEVQALTGLESGGDGTVDPGALERAAARLGVTRSRTRRLLGVLAEQDLLVRRTGSRSAPPLPPPRQVVVEGTGPLAWQVATLLRASGVPRVELGREAADDLEHRLRSSAPDVDPPALVVLTGRPVVPAHRGDPWRSHAVPVLPVVLEGRRVLVGPMVRDDVGPCLHCLDRVRTDLDAAWPLLATQGADGLPPDDDTLTTLAAAVVVLLVRAHLDGPGVPLGVSVEAALPWPRLDHRRWTRHPHCPHHRARRAAPGAAETPGAARGTMTG